MTVKEFIEKCIKCYDCETIIKLLQERNVDMNLNEKITDEKMWFISRIVSIDCMKEYRHNLLEISK